MRTPASIKHHPIHPILVTFPIALWIFSLAADVIRFANLGPPDVWREVAFYSMAAGIVGALLAALPGLIDLFSIADPHLKRIGIIHMVMNLIIVAIFVINWGPAKFERALSPVHRRGGAAFHRRLAGRGPGPRTWCQRGGTAETGGLSWANWTR